MRTTLLSTVLLFVACASKEAAVAPTPQPKQTVAAKADTVKPGLPTTLSSKVDGKTAQLSLRFDAAGERVSVSLTGIDGVTITQAPELPKDVKVQAGEVRELPVTFTASGVGHLVLTVTGQFGSGVRQQVHSVQVGEGARKDLGTVQTTNDGDVVKVIP